MNALPFGVKGDLLNKARLYLPSLEPRASVMNRVIVNRSASAAATERFGFEYREVAGSAVGVGILQTVKGCLATIILVAAMLSGAAAANRSPAAGEEATPPQIQQLLTLLADPKIQVWLKQQNETRSAAASALDAAEESPSHYLDARIGAIREHLLALAHTVPDVPHQFARGAARVSAELGEHGRAEVLK